MRWRLSGAVQGEDRCILHGRVVANLGFYGGGRRCFRGG
jgi:hypothetical protein